MEVRDMKFRGFLIFVFSLSVVYPISGSANADSNGLYDEIRQVDQQIGDLDDHMANLASQAKKLIRRVSSLQEENARLQEEIEFTERNERQMQHYDREDHYSDGK